MVFLPEGSLWNIPSNLSYMSSVSSVRDAMHAQTVLEARALKCDSDHNLHVDLGCMRGIIPREEGALGIADGSVRDIALISRVGKAVCFVVQDLVFDNNGQLVAMLSRRRAQELCNQHYVSTLQPGDVVTVRVTHCEPFGAFCDIGAGVASLLPIDAVSVSRIPHPGVRFYAGQEIRCVVKGTDSFGRILLTHKELLGTWEENAALFTAGETVSGTVRSVEPYGIFVELTPNLAGLAEYTPDVKVGQRAAVYIKSILPDKMKVKLILVDSFDEKAHHNPPRYFFEGEHMDSFLYSPACAAKRVETIF
ncbi:MAG: 30S ribosomal protein S1 [Clostridia bacterium]|nr:30S ribosomal protein S1 [Clostridia bacterium]MBR2414243.1 30S ribosomal protein S1 [Clostridia bacterium]